MQIFTQNEALPRRSWLPEIVKFLSSRRTAEGLIEPVSGEVAELVTVIRDWKQQKAEYNTVTRHNSCTGVGLKLDSWQIVTLQREGSTVIIIKADKGKPTRQ